MSIFGKKSEKKDENTDEFHREYGVISNIRYIFSAFVKYRKSLIFLLISKTLPVIIMTMVMKDLIALIL